MATMTLSPVLTSVVAVGYVLVSMATSVHGYTPNGHAVATSNISRECKNAYYTPPKCIDHPDGYGCDCGPGFYWNTYVCVSTAVDSRLEFSHQTPVRYTLLLGKAFPKLTEFTIAFWIKVPDPSINGTILSYKRGSTLNLLHMRSGPNLTFQVWDFRVESSRTFRANVWYHVVWTWSSLDGKWALYIDGRPEMSGQGGKNQAIPLGGEFVLGQASRDKFAFNEQFAFVGQLTHMNIWSFVITGSQVNAIRKSCDLMYCGDAVQWIDLRTGTRGAMKMRWPSGVLRTKSCFSEDEVGITCNKYCSDTIGAQCNEQIVENIRWARTKANNQIRVPCPEDTLMPRQEPEDVNVTAHGSRSCNLMKEENEGEWGQADIDDCISHPLRTLKYKFQQYLMAKYTDETTVLDLCGDLLNHTASEAYGNPVDVATVIDLLEMLVNTQAGLQEMTVQWNDGNRTYARALDHSPTRAETEQFMELIVDIVNNLLSERHDSGWNATRPLGVEGDNLMKVLETLAQVLAVSLDYHMRDQEITTEEAVLKIARPEIELNVQAQWVENFHGTRFPRDSMYATNMGEIEMPGVISVVSNDSEIAEFIKIAILRLRGISIMLPNHDPRGTGKKAKENNVNTPIIAMFLYGGKADISTNMTEPLVYTLPFLDTFNISNPECVRLEHGTVKGSRINEWQWTREGCDLREEMTNEGGVCACSVAGVFAITTDMYNDNWNKGEVRPILMSFASYIGCCASITLCLATCILHIYYNTSSSTASLHKNLGVSVVLGQLAFMIGIDLYDHKFVCQIFAICLHYFFLANFSWLMNECFNLYIVITYSSHSHGGHQESGSLLRYYILGWVIPGVLVGSFVGSQGELYYAKDMCWVSWDNLWLFIGPAIGIISVSIMVLIFTAKEHNENSYTKSEQSNKFITLLMKALWTQIILITVVWSFAFISLKMSDRILKYIFGLFNCLQGSFFFVFYLLLNEEVRSIFKTNRKKKTLTAHGYEDTDDRSIDSQASAHVIEKDRLETLALDPRPRRRKDQKRRQKQKKGSHVHAAEEDDKMGSDCEMITSV